MEKEGGSTKTKITLIIVMITSFITPFMSNAISLAIPSIAKEFGSSQELINWVVSGFLISTAAFLLPFGRLADQYGRKKIFLTGAVLLAASALACALSTSLAALICFRIIQGIASAMIFSNSMAILTSVVPPQSRGRALGMNSAATYIGLSCGPVLGGFICGAFSWRGVFYFNFLLALIIISLTFWKLKGEWKGETGRTDGCGMFLCIAAQALLLFGLTELTSGLLYQSCFVTGILLLTIFVIYEKKRNNPLIPVRDIIKNRPFALSSLAAFINYSATFALTFMLSLYLQTVAGMETAKAGLILLVQPVIMAVLSPVTGMLSDKIKPSILASAGMGITALGLFFFIFLREKTTMYLFIANLAFIGLGFALFASPNTNAIMGSVDRSLYGVASSIMGNMRLLGQSVSMAVVSLIMSILMRGMLIGSENYGAMLMLSLKISFIIFTVLCAAGVFVSMARGRHVSDKGGS